MNNFDAELTFTTCELEKRMQEFEKSYPYAHREDFQHSCGHCHTYLPEIARYKQ